MITRLLAILSLFTTQFCKGLDKGPEILRICLDNNSSIATLNWQSPIDNCNSFKKYCIYSSQNKGPWKLDTIITSINTTSIGIFISDLSSEWDFKIITHSACNGIDSFESKPQSIDQNKPFDLDLDSVSFDYATQKLSAGWKRNASPDTKGYRVYNYANSVSDKILDTDRTNIILNDFDKNNPAKITLATFDSCDLFSKISLEQQAAYLSGKIDTCTKSISFSWSQYQGWPTPNQYLILNKNNTGFIKYSDLGSGQTKYLFTNINLGDNLCYYVRTEDVVTKKTSSSNTVCFLTRKLLPPKVNYLSNVTVDNDKIIKLFFEVDNKADTDSLLIEKAENSSSFKSFLQLPRIPNKTTYALEDLEADFNNKSYSYRVKTIDKCGNISSESNIGKSIFLLSPIAKDNMYEFNWNLYSGWEKGVNIQSIEVSTNRFTWNLLKNETNSNTKFIYSGNKLESDSLCFRIKNDEELNSLNNSSISISNIKCVYTIRDFYLPSIINPFSNNNTFRVFGNGLDKSRGKMEIYNRWGEKIFETSNLEVGWDGKINGDYALQGSYIYTVGFYDYLNKHYLKTGSLFIIR